MVSISRYNVESYDFHINRSPLTLIYHPSLGNREKVATAELTSGWYPAVEHTGCIVNLVINIPYHLHPAPCLAKTISFGWEIGSMDGFDFGFCLAS